MECCIPALSGDKILDYVRFIAGDKKGNQMKRVLMTSALVATATAAFGADLPSRKAAPAYEPPLPVLTWAGGSVGIQLGGVFGSGSTNVSSWGSGGGCSAQTTVVDKIIKVVTKTETPSTSLINPCVTTSTSTISRVPIKPVPTATLIPTPLGGNAAAATNGNISGSGGAFIGGGAANYRWQTGSFVYGGEITFSGLAGGGANGTVSGVSTDGTFNFLGSTHVSRKLNWMGTVNAQLGYAVMPQLLVFAEGGLAYGGVSSHTSIWGSATPISGTWAGGSWFGEQGISKTLVGWNAGAGVEYLFNPNWSARLSYRYYDLGSANYNVAWGGSGMAGSTQVHNRFNGNIVQAGIFFHPKW